MASDGKDFKQDISADPTNFLAGWQKAVAGASSGAESMKSSIDKIGDAFSAIQKPLLVISAMFAGGAFFKDAIGAANKFNGECMGLVKSLAITGTQASTLNTALGDIGSDTDTYVGAFQKFAKQLKNNEEGLQQMGLKTRDANGNLRDSNTLFTEALGTVGGYKAGLDQNIAAQTLFGKGVAEVMTLQKLNNQVLEEAKQKNAALGLTITQEGVEASKKYKLAINDVGDVFLAIKKTIGEAVMPVFTELSEYFASTGPYVINVFRGALTGLVLVFEVVKAAVVFLAKQIFETINTIIDVEGLMGDVFGKLFSGDFSGAFESSKDIGKRIGSAFTNGVQNAVDSYEGAVSGTANGLSRIWGKGTEVAAPNKGTKTMGDLGKTKDSSRMAEWEATLAADKAGLERQGMLEGQYREMSKAAELKYWADIKSRQGLSSTERTALSRKTAELEMAGIKQGFEVKVASLQAEAAAYKNNTTERLRIELEIQAKYQQGTKQYEESAKRIVEIQRQAAEQERAIRSSRVQAERDARLQTVALEEQTIQSAAQLGLITQEQVLASQAQFEQRRNAIAREAIQERLQIALLDKDKNPVEIEKINTELEALERAHQLRLGQIRGAQAVDSAKYQTQFFQGMQSSMQGSIQNILNGTQTIGQGFRSLFAGIGQSLAQTVSKMATDWIMGQIKMRLASKETSMVQLNNNAMAAAGAAYNSVVGIPYIGPFLAPAAAAVAYAGVMAFGSLASAEGGFDIPGNVNPIVQTHAREMILPAKHADVIRSLADQGQGVAAVSGGDVHMHVHTQSTQDFQNFLSQNSHVLAPALRRLGRNFSPTKA